MAGEPTKAVNFRFPISLIERLDEQVERLREEQPGLKIDRSDVVRMLLLRALELEQPRKRKR